MVRKLPQGAIKVNDVLSLIFNGVVTRSVRCFNPEQEDYCGLIECKDDDYLLNANNPNEPFEFSMASLADIHDFVQKDDIVTFQIELNNGDKKRAVNVKPCREKYQVRFRRLPIWKKTMESTGIDSKFELQSFFSMLIENVSPHRLWSTR